MLPECVDGFSRWITCNLQAPKFETNELQKQQNIEVLMNIQKQTGHKKQADGKQTLKIEKEEKRGKELTKQSSSMVKIYFFLETI